VEAQSFFVEQRENKRRALLDKVREKLKHKAMVKPERPASVLRSEKSVTFDNASMRTS
jgi:mannitol/fructose-specific phosphotransferase system IIA component